jgi:predicted house-cleaning noncanonical NTP pyrophosphatase (MazG superfamily)
MFKLIRDKIPELAKADGKVLNYATAENEELYIALLKNKFAEEASEFLASGAVEELADVLTVVNAIIDICGITRDEFNKVYQDKLEKVGGFEKRYIGFFPDTKPQTTSVETAQPVIKPTAKD